MSPRKTIEEEIKEMAPEEIAALCKKVIERNSGLNGDPLHSPYGWLTAYKLAIILNGYMNLPETIRALLASVKDDSGAVFSMMPSGVTHIDEPKMRDLAARRPADGAMQPFLATVIMQLYDLMTSSRLKGATPDRVRVVMNDG